MSVRFGAVLASMALWLGGCAALEQAQRDWVDKGITVSGAADLSSYRRVGVERAICRGQGCRAINEEQVVQELRRHLTRACYETVDAADMERYAEHYGRSVGFSFGMDMPDMPRIEFVAIAPDLRDVVVSELGLDGIIKTSIDLGAPDEVTQWRPTTLNVELVDARGFQGVWQGQLTQEGEDAETAQRAVMLAQQLGEGLARRASACRAPVAPAVAAPAQDYGIAQVGDQLNVPGRIYFELGSAQLSSRSNALLDDLAAFLRARSEITHLSIEGHTDDVGDEADNLRLSEGRAQAVVDYLVAAGVARGRLSAAGHGEGRPRVSNDSAANRAQNRRVEFIVVR